MILLLNRKFLFFFLLYFFATTSIGYAFCVKIQNPKDNDTVSGAVNIAAGFYPNKCDKNESYKEINDLFSNIDTDFDKDLIRAIAWQESGWCQFDPNGNVYACVNNAGTDKQSTDYGIMQINSENSAFDSSNVQNNLIYNINAGVSVLEGKSSWITDTQNNRPRKWKSWSETYDLSGHSMQDIILKAYNGFQQLWTYPDAINNIIQNKPWLQKVSGSLAIDGETKLKKDVSLIDLLQYDWDTSNVNEGSHDIKADAVSKSVATSDAIKVNIQKIVGVGEITQVCRTSVPIIFIIKPETECTTIVTIKDIYEQNINLDKNGKIVWKDQDSLSYYLKCDVDIKINIPDISVHNESQSTTQFKVIKDKIFKKMQINISKRKPGNIGPSEYFSKFNLEPYESVLDPKAEFYVTMIGLSGNEWFMGSSKIIYDSGGVMNYPDEAIGPTPYYYTFLNGKNEPFKIILSNKYCQGYINLTNKEGAK